ncbi:MAG: hypothetical protein ACYC8T_09050 [Myxococcaceae bacterium]
MRARGALGLVAVVVACGCGPAGKKATPKPPLVTERGTPAGQVALLSIGPSGGAVASADGLLSVTVPPGALGAASDVQVVPITNHAPGGRGDGYRLSPEGQTFSAPVTLTFHYSDAQLTGTAPEALGLAYQDEEGTWRSLKAVALDASAKTVSVTTTHFSDWSMVSGFQLRPPSAGVNVNEQLPLEVVFCQSQQQDEVSTLLALCEPTAVFPVTSWSVNGVANGSGSVGTVQETQQGVAEYTAPGTKPQSNPVAVSAEVTLGKTRVMLVANVTVAGARRWEGTVSTLITENQPGLSELTITTEAAVTFMFDEATQQYTPGGTVTYDYRLKVLVDPCATTGSYSGALAPGDGSLTVIDSGTGPELYTAFGWKMATVNGTSTCNDTKTPETAFITSTINWWASNTTLPVNLDGTIEGSETKPTGGGTIVSKWRLVPTFVP